MTGLPVHRRLAKWLAAILRGISNRIDHVGAQPLANDWKIPSMPTWVQEEVLEMSFIEPELVPPGGDVSKYAFYSVPSDPGPGEAYFRVLEDVGDDKYTHALIIPWLKQGGADRGIIYHAQAIMAEMPNARVLVLATENAESPWVERLPAGAVYIPFGKLLGHLDFEKQVGVMVRLLVQLQIPLVHIVNSRVGWEVVRRYPLALKQTSRLYASLFCDDYDAHMVPVGYARDYLRDCYGAFEAIFCDNSCYPEVWWQELGIPRATFTVLPFPYDGDVDSTPSSAITKNGAGRILWAGRLDRQKRPDILAGIAARMPEVHFDVYGAQVMSQGDDGVELLARLPNVTMHGEFRRLEEVASEEHFAYLHTTAWEGTPTILFDVAAVGLPICAPAVGGIVDFLARDQLVQDPEDVDEFIARLEVLKRQKNERDRAVGLQAAALRSRHSWAAFIWNLRLASRYFSVGEKDESP